MTIATPRGLDSRETGVSNRLVAQNGPEALCPCNEVRLVSDRHILKQHTTPLKGYLQLDHQLLTATDMPRLPWSSTYFRRGMVPTVVSPVGLGICQFQPAATNSIQLKGFARKFSSEQPSSAPKNCFRLNAATGEWVVFSGNRRARYVCLPRAP